MHRLGRRAGLLLRAGADRRRADGPERRGLQAIDSEDATGDGHAFEWVTHVGPGNHLVELERRVGNPNTMFTQDD